MMRTTSATRKCNRCPIFGTDSRGEFMKHIKRRMEMKKALAVATTLVALGSVPACATDVSGSASGIFVNPQPAGATTIGIGTSDIKYGVGFGGSLPNDLTFAGTAFASPFETPFT